MRIRPPVLLVVLAFVLPLFSYATDNSWTNHAGHALKATPQSISGENVTFVRGTPGQTVTYPLAVFLPAEQERLRCCLKDLTLPEGLKAAHDFSARIITRSRLLKENGSKSEKDYQKALETTASAFRAQAAPFIEKKQLSKERLEYIVRELVTPPEKKVPASKDAQTLTQ
ncbi:MAG: hypothetical protein WCP12_17995 [bacterium]